MDWSRSRLSWESSKDLPTKHADSMRSNDWEMNLSQLAGLRTSRPAVLRTDSCITRYSRGRNLYPKTEP